MKRLLTLMTAAMLMMTLAACQSTPADVTSGATPGTSTATTPGQTTKDSTTTSAAAATSPAETTTKQTTAPVQTTVADAGIRYENDTLGFALTLPASWKDRYLVYEGDRAASFRSALCDQKEENSGQLFSIVVEDELPEDEIIYPDFRVLSKKNGKMALVLLPTDVPYDYEDAQLVDEYNDLSKDITAIADSFVWLDDDARG